METKIYAVRNTHTAEVRLVEAKTKQQALAHVAKSTFVAALADQKELVDAVRKGVKVEHYGDVDGEEEEVI